MTGEVMQISSFESFTPILLLIGLGLFGWLTVKSRNVKSFQFQLSLFMAIWIVGEAVDFFQEEELVIGVGSNAIGLYVHFTAMAVFSVMIWVRFLLAKKAGKRLLDDLRES